jgi:hypothetical protein
MRSRGIERYPRSVYRIRRRSRGPARSFIWSVRKLAWSRIGSTLLAIIVALTLTLICQGHDHGTEHIGPHLTFLGESVDGQSASSISIQAIPEFSPLDSAVIDMVGMDMPGAAMQASWQFPIPANGVTSNSVGANIASAVTNAPLESTSLSTVSLMLLMMLLWRDPHLRPLEIAEAIRRRSQSIASPEPPPPRFGFA